MAHRERKRDREQAAERVGKCRRHVAHITCWAWRDSRHCRQLQLAMHTNAVPCSLYDVMACATCDACASSRAPKSMLRIFSCLLPWRRRLMRRAAVAAAATLSRRLCSFCAFFFWLGFLLRTNFQNQYLPKVFCIPNNLWKQLASRRSEAEGAENIL